MMKCPLWSGICKVKGPCSLILRPGSPPKVLCADGTVFRASPGRFVRPLAALQEPVLWGPHRGLQVEVEDGLEIGKRVAEWLGCPKSPAPSAGRRPVPGASVLASLLAKVLSRTGRSVRVWWTGTALALDRLPEDPGWALIASSVRERAFEASVKVTLKEAVRLRKLMAPQGGCREEGAAVICPEDGGVRIEPRDGATLQEALSSLVRYEVSVLGAYAFLGRLPRRCWTYPGLGCIWGSSGGICWSGSRVWIGRKSGPDWLDGSAEAARRLWLTLRRALLQRGL